MEIKVKTATTEYAVTTTRIIKVGSTFRISPSFGCPDIKNGIIEVIRIGNEEEINLPNYDFESWEVGNDTARESKWVAYKYRDDEDYIEVLPLEEFVNHVSIV